MALFSGSESKSVLESLLQIMADPKAVKSTLEDLKNAVVANEAKLAALVEAQTAMAAREEVANKRESELNKKSSNLATLEDTLGMKKVNLDSLIAEYNEKIAKLKAITG